MPPSPAGTVPCRPCPVRLACSGASDAPKSTVAFLICVMPAARADRLIVHPDAFGARRTRPTISTGSETRRSNPHRVISTAFNGPARPELKPRPAAPRTALSHSPILQICYFQYVGTYRRMSYVCDTKNDRQATGRLNFSSCDGATGTAFENHGRIFCHRWAEFAGAADAAHRVPQAPGRASGHGAGGRTRTAVRGAAQHHVDASRRVEPGRARRGRARRPRDELPRRRQGVSRPGEIPDQRLLQRPSRFVRRYRPADSRK